MRNLRLLDDIPKYTSASWARNELEIGKFSLSLPDAELRLDWGDLEDQLFVVRRDVGLGPVVEFAGCIQEKDLARAARIITLTGPDLLCHLKYRQTIPGPFDASDDVTNVAVETAMKHYVNGNLVNPLDHDRAASEDFDVPWLIEPDQGRGVIVSYTARWQRLLDVLVELGRANEVDAISGIVQPLGNTPSGMIHEVFLPQDNIGNFTGYLYRVREPVDATVTGGAPVVFSTEWKSVLVQQYSENFTDLVNALYVMGSGSGAGRTIQKVTDPDSIKRHFRREGTLDGRQAGASLDTLAHMGSAYIATLERNAVGGSVTPLLSGPYLYRQDYDVGYDVTVQIEDRGISNNLRIAGVQVDLAFGRPEQIALTLGVAQRSLVRSTVAALRRLNPVLVV